MPRGRPKKQHSISELQTMLKDRRKQRSKLLGEKKKLQAKIDQVDRKLANLDGEAAAAGNGAMPGTRSRNAKNLPDAIEEVMRKKGSAMGIADIASAVQANGYESTSANFRGIVNQALIKDDRFTSESRGKYVVK